MITQTLKRWLTSLFAWWPWKTSTIARDSDPASNMSWKITAESARPSTANGTQPATPMMGNTSIAIEQTSFNTPTPNTEIPQDLSDQLQAEHNDNVPTTPTIFSNKKTRKLEASSSTSNENEEPSLAERQLLFLNYLVQSGVFNEGFQKGQTPAQYKGKKP
ncbi:hypothetical protein KDA_21560 [Dictyobacter alpinus]|uniref:Uncharacterized protein n=1 Tax=Dictyobacter alpinus TaxID=2014873 RepID=A0A402B5P2_9CHLR|nr:hypothetical protein [Dictyobacter alpinus]GCE26672.1 hypothetical protein KDA_21560 [Dictyobacter alpinus]